MSESKVEIEAALAQIETRWDERRTESTLSGARRKLARRRQTRVVVASVGAVSLVLIVSAWVLRARDATLARGADKPVAAVAGPRAQRMQLADGSEVSALDSVTDVVVHDTSSTRTNLELSKGHARFDVVHRPSRVFRVVCGEVTVEVLGTAFELERAGARTRVAVERGRVAVSWKDGRTELGAGEAGWFPRAPEHGRDDSRAAIAEPAVDEVITTDGAGSLTPSVHRAGPRAHSAAPPQSWREPAEHGDFAQAYELLQATKHPPADDVEELMLAADTARLSGHPEAALPFLERVVNDHTEDSRAPLAAFTLGGVLMHQLARPSEAEAAYGKARSLALHSSLAQDALARQVEAAHRAGDAPLARTLAAEYLASYPNGRRVNAVRRFAGLLQE